MNSIVSYSHDHSDAGPTRSGLAAAAAIAMLDLYRAIVSPVLIGLFGHACRFHPTCSVYARQAIERHGLARGACLAIRRLSRCRPGGGWGDDPVPRRDDAVARP